MTCVVYIKLEYQCLVRGVWFLRLAVFANSSVYKVNRTSLSLEFARAGRLAGPSLKSTLCLLKHWKTERTMNQNNGQTFLRRMQALVFCRDIVWPCFLRLQEEPKSSALDHSGMGILRHFLVKRVKFGDKPKMSQDSEQFSHCLKHRKRSLPEWFPSKNTALRAHDYDWFGISQ